MGFQREKNSKCNLKGSYKRQEERNNLYLRYSKSQIV